MVASGKLSVDDAIELLAALEPAPSVGAPDQVASARTGSFTAEPPFTALEGLVGVGRLRPGVPPPRRPPMPHSMIGRSLRFEVQDDDESVTASLPLGLIGSEGRFLPRRVRQALEESEVDLDQIRDLILNGGDQLERHCTLLEISDGEDKRLIINLT